MESPKVEINTPRNYDVIDFRLTSIEKGLADLKDVMLETKMQERDIKDLTTTQNELLKAINSHDQRIKNLELAPTQKKADRWQFIVEYAFKTLVAGVIIYFIRKIGLPA